MKTYKDTISGETLYVSEQKFGSVYYKNKAMNIYHRVDGPAMVWYDGTERWFQNGRAHRMDGPATVWPSGGTDWWINGERITYMRDRYKGPGLLQQRLDDLKDN